MLGVKTHTPLTESFKQIWNLNCLCKILNIQHNILIGHLVITLRTSIANLFFTVTKSKGFSVLTASPKTFVDHKTLQQGFFVLCGIIWSFMSIISHYLQILSVIISITLELSLGIFSDWWPNYSFSNRKWCVVCCVWIVVNSLMTLTCLYLPNLV